MQDKPMQCMRGSFISSTSTKNNMKNIVITLFALVSLASLFSCSNEIYDRSENYPTLTPSANDDLAGTWRPILLSAPDEFSLDISPISVTLSAEAVIHWEAVTAVDGRPAGFSLPMTLAGRVGELDFVEIVFRFRPPFWRCCFIVSSQSLDTSRPHWCGETRYQW